MFLRDVRFAARMLAKSPGFTAVSVLCLALGIGANSTIFSLVDGFWTRPLPVRDPGGLVYLFTSTPKGQDDLSYAEFLDYQSRAKSFSGLLAAERRSPILSGDGFADATLSNVVNEDYFAVLGVGAQLGRVFTPADAGTGQRVVVMSYNMWQRRFGGDPGIVGRSIRLSGSYTVVGVAPKGFHGTELWSDPDFWIPMSSWDPSGDESRVRDYRSYSVMGRLHPGVSAEAARAELAGISAQLEQAEPKFNRGCRAVLLTATQYLLRWDVPFLLLGIVALVLLIACANVAGLLLARAGSRSHEISVRLAVGADRRRLVAQLMAESTLIGVLGAGAGLLLAAGLIALLPGVIIPPSNSYMHYEFRLDYRVVVFTLAISIATVFLFGLVPALRASRADLTEALKGAAGRSARRGSRARSVLVVFQVALSIVLLSGAGVLLRTFVYCMNADPGFERREMLLADVSPPYGGERAHNFFPQLLEQVRGMPGVGEATLAMRAPLSGSGGGLAQGVTLPDQPAARVKFTGIGLNYFRTMGIGLLRGRDFDSRDGPHSARVLVVNETMARRFWPNADPIGKTVRLAQDPPGTERAVVGVVRDTRINSIREDAQPYFYLPFEQTQARYMWLILTTTGDPFRLARPLRRTVAAMDPRIPILEMTSMRLLIRSTLYEQQTSATMVGGLGLIGLFLAAIGLYGVISYAVAERTHEIGIRMALGAQRGDALWMVLRQGLTLAAAGAGIGVVGAFFGTSVLKDLVYGVNEHDPVTFAGVVVLILAVALAASYVPARRATKVDPMVALRWE